MTDAASRIARIQGVQFRPVFLAKSYAMAEVDDLLDDLVAATHEGRPVTPLIEAARFRQVRFREGYSTPEVDEFLDELRATA